MRRLDRLRCLSSRRPQDGFAPIQHRRIPDQIVVDRREARELRIGFATALRALDLSAPGLASAIAGSAVGPIVTVRLDVAYAATRFQPLRTLPQGEFAAELAAHGSRTTVDLSVITEERIH